jgi:uncharacterized protein
MRGVRVAVAAALIVVLLPVGLVAQRLPSPQGYVNDFAGVVSDDDEARMRGIITAVQEQTGAEIAVVAVDSIAPYATIEQYGIALADEWDVGAAGEDNGVILIVAVQERQGRIEVGYGLEGAIPDGRAGGILDEYVLPDLRSNDYGAGLLNGVAALAEVIADEYGVTLTGVRAEPRGSNGDSSSTLDLSDIVYVVFLLLFVGGRWFFWPLLFAGRRRGFYGGGFGSSGGGRPSSFGGFGGGGFGGGGASRGF